MEIGLVSGRDADRALIALGGYDRKLLDMLFQHTRDAEWINRTAIASTIREAARDTSTGWWKHKLVYRSPRGVTGVRRTRKPIVLAARAGATLAVGIAWASQQSRFSPGSGWEELRPWRLDVQGCLSDGTMKKLREWARRSREDRIRLHIKTALALADAIETEQPKQGGLFT